MKWVKKKDGKEFAIINQHTFYCHKKTMTTINWPCSNASCRSRLITTNEDDPRKRQILSLKEEHAHPPRNYVIVHGFYVKV